jgi:hypothetical protein
MCIDIDIVLTKLKSGLTSEVKTLLDELQKDLNKLVSSEIVVNSKFYLASSELRKVRLYTIFINIFVVNYYICDSTYMTLYKII